MALFDDGVHPVEAIKRLRLPPAVVTKCYREWAELRGGMFVPEMQLREICARAQTSFPLRDAAHLAKEIARAWPKGNGPAVCECGLEPAKVCHGCAAGLAVQAARRRAVEEKEERERRLFERDLARTAGGLEHARERSAAASRARGKSE
jgi:hypothetical protein